MKNLIEFLSDFMNVWTLIYVVLILFFAILAMVFFKRLKSAKKKLKDYKFYNTVSAQTIEDYDNQIKLQDCEIAERKKYFEDAIVEITKLTSENKLLKSCNQDNLKSIKYWKERALHQKHTKKVVESINSDLWECINDQDYMKELFNMNNRYKELNIKSNKDNLLFLIGNDNASYLVYKKDFKLVQL